MRCRIGIVALAIYAWMLVAGTQAQQHEIYLGPEDAVQPAGSSTPVNYLAKCLANPDDRMSCLIARTAEKDGGLESAIKGQMDAAGYVTCDAPDGVCLEIATLDLADDNPVAPAARLKSVDVTILFEYDSSAIESAEERKLIQLAAALKDPLNGEASFAVIGHTDSKGNDAYNCRLSQKRARAVASHLTAEGILQERLTIIGAGEHLLRNPADGEAAENRRVGFARLDGEGSIVMKRLSKLCKTMRTEN